MAKEALNLAASLPGTDCGSDNFSVLNRKGKNLENDDNVYALSAP